MEKKTQQFIGGLLMAVPVAIWVYTFNAHNCIAGGCHTEWSLVLAGALFFVSGLWMLAKGLKEEDKNKKD